LGIVFLGSKTSCLSLGDDGIGLGDDRIGLRDEDSEIMLGTLVKKIHARGVGLGGIKKMLGHDMSVEQC
jgi:hypothetical protein